jgi:hypothetical protein
LGIHPPLIIEGIQIKNSFNKILSVSFDLGLLKVDTYGIKNVKNEYLVMN